MTDQASMPPVCRRWPLYVSLFVNVALIALLVAGAWRIHIARQNIMTGGLMTAQAERTLEEPARSRVRAVREAHQGELRPLSEAFRAARRKAEAAFDAEPFDQAAFSSTLADLRAARTKLDEARDSMMAEMAAQLSSNDRKKMRARMKKSGRDGEKGPNGPAGSPD